MDGDWELNFLKENKGEAAPCKELSRKTAFSHEHRFQTYSCDFGTSGPCLVTYDIKNLLHNTYQQLIHVMQQIFVAFWKVTLQNLDKQQAFQCNSC